MCVLCSCGYVDMCGGCVCVAHVFIWVRGLMWRPKFESKYLHLLLSMLDFETRLSLNLELLSVMRPADSDLKGSSCFHPSQYYQGNSVLLHLGFRSVLGI